MIHTRSLTKDFVVSRAQTVHAVRDIDLDIAPGELVAVLGPNGAGKTSTMRMLTTLIRPTSGTATVAGHDIVTEAAQVRRRIGYVGQGNGAGHTQRARDELYTQALVCRKGHRRRSRAGHRRRYPGRAQDPSRRRPDHPDCHRRCSRSAPRSAGCPDARFPRSRRGRTRVTVRVDDGPGSLPPLLHAA